MNATPAVRAAIRATSAFRDISEADLAFLVESSELRFFEPAAALMRQGEPSACAMLILDGEVTVAADSSRGEIPVSTLKAPALVGELGSLARLPRSATARARTPVTAL
jgi:phosphoserine phosphatase RsbU/P